MKRNKVVTTGLGLLIAFTGAFGVAACSGGDDKGGGDKSNSAEEANVDIKDDLEAARKAVADTLAEDDSWDQIMLAGDVKKPTQKYGLLVVPYTHSDAAKKVQSTIDIKDGKFTIQGESAATGKTWQIDQDGKITEVAK